jgi:hypothetical protein
VENEIDYCDGKYDKQQCDVSMERSDKKESNESNSLEGTDSK